MRIKKKQIEEVVNTSNTTGRNTKNKALGQTPSDSDIKRVEKYKKEYQETVDLVKNNELPFIEKVSENTFDPNYGKSGDLELHAWQDEEIRNAFHEWLVSTPEGQAYAEKLSQPQINQPENNPTDDLPFESFKDKRTVIKTIKVKDLK